MKMRMLTLFSAASAAALLAASAAPATPPPASAASAAVPVATRAPANETLAIGEPAPMTHVKMRGVDGKEYSIAGVAGKHGTLVIFSCNSCPWVVAWEPRIARIGNTYQEKGFGVIVINSNDPSAAPVDSYEAMVERARERGFEFPYVVDATSDVARAFGATRTPEVFLLDAGGRLAYHGVIDDNAFEPSNVGKRFLEDALEALMAGAEVPVKETKALGCTIKFRTASSGGR